jgi:putative spermidine/putrescine transport system permease protein
MGKDLSVPGRMGRPSLLHRHPWMVLVAPAWILSSLLVAALATIMVYSFFSDFGGKIGTEVTLTTWATVLADPFFWHILLATLTLAATVTVATLIVGYPTAYALTKVRSRRLTAVAYVIIFSPLLVSIVVRAYGWVLMLGDKGVVNVTLQGLGITKSPVHLVFNAAGVDIALVHACLAFVVFPIVNSLGQIPAAMKEGAQDLGASRLQTFFRITLPLTLPGVIAGCQLVFIYTLGTFVTPALVGGGRVLVMGELVYEDVQNFVWPRASIEVFGLLFVTVVVVLVTLRLTQRTYLGGPRARE